MRKREEYMCTYIYGHLQLGLSRPPGGDYNPIVFAMQFGLIRVVRPCQALRLHTNRLQCVPDYLEQPLQLGTFRRRRPP